LLLKYFKEPRLIEFITLTILSILVISIMRPGKTPPLENSLTIERPGRYRMKLAPQLNLAQPFFEVIAERLLTLTTAPADNLVWWFEITDKNVAAHGHQYYFLKMNWRAGLWEFEAIAPTAKSIENDQSAAEVIKEDEICAVVFSVAKQLKIMATAVAEN
jgi:hypothetical protein